MSNTVRITEIFYSLQGEAKTSGYPTVFIRLTGCPLRCVYCDSEYAFYGGDRLTFAEILAQTQNFATKYVCVTGGEPLAQPSVHALLALLCDQGLWVSLETSGAMPLDAVDPRVSIVMDLKTPSSGECGKNRLENLPLLAAKDQVKFVIADKADFDWVCFKLDEYQLADRVGEVLLSPSFGVLPADQLAAWILEAKLPVRLQIQLHKVLWGDVPGV